MTYLIIDFINRWRWVFLAAVAIALFPAPEGDIAPGSILALFGPVLVLIDARNGIGRVRGTVPFRKAHQPAVLWFEAVIMFPMLLASAQLPVLLMSAGQPVSLTLLRVLVIFVGTSGAAGLMFIFASGIFRIYLGERRITNSILLYLSMFYYIVGAVFKAFLKTSVDVYQHGLLTKVEVNILFGQIPFEPGLTGVHVLAIASFTVLCAYIEAMAVSDVGAMARGVKAWLFDDGGIRNARKILRSFPREYSMAGPVLTIPNAWKILRSFPCEYSMAGPVLTIPNARKKLRFFPREYSMAGLVLTFYYELLEVFLLFACLLFSTMIVADFLALEGFMSDNLYADFFVNNAFFLLLHGIAAFRMCVWLGAIRSLRTLPMRRTGLILRLMAFPLIPVFIAAAFESIFSIGFSVQYYLRTITTLLIFAGVAWWVGVIYLRYGLSSKSGLLWAGIYALVCVGDKVLTWLGLTEGQESALYLLCTIAMAVGAFLAFRYLIERDSTIYRHRASG